MDEQIRSDRLILGKKTIFEELKKLHHHLTQPFPYRDTRKIYQDFKESFSEEDCLNADLNTYWMYIAGSLSYVLNGKANKTPKNQIERIHLSFFDIFKQYRFLENRIEKYPTFYKEYMYYERARKLLIYYLS